MENVVLPINLSADEKPREVQRMNDLIKQGYYVTTITQQHDGYSFFLVKPEEPLLIRVG